MDLETIRNALGRLQQDAESEQAWQSLRQALAEDAALGTHEVHGILAAARSAHAARGEWHAVAALMPLEVETCVEDGERVLLLMELGRVRQQELLDEPGAIAIYNQVLELSPGDEIAEAAIAESDERRSTWKEMATEYLREANSAPDDAYKAAMLMRSAEVEWRFADDALDEEKLIGLLAEAAEADPRNYNVQRMLERIYRRASDLKGLAVVLERWAKYGDEDSGRVAAAIRLARLHKNRLEDSDAAASAYELVLAIVPDQAEAMEALVDHYSSTENWDRLVQLYERELEQLDLSRPERVGDMLQIAMLHYKKRESLGDAALWFERIRAIEPTNSALLEFYREYCSNNEDEGLLLKVLQSAQRVLPEGKDKQAITREIAQLAERQEDAQKAIDQYKALLRQNPDNPEARQSLKSLYRATQGYNQLVDLLRHELEGIPETARDERLSILREVAGVYREHLPSETSLVSALNQILQADDTDVPTVRELISLYEKLGRWRDLLANQQRLADLTKDPEERASLLRAAGNRWLSQFSNVQNATLAFEALLAVVPSDREARDTLADLYRKRRAWPSLYALYESEVASLDGAQRLAVMKEMARLAAERLGQPETAARLYREILTAEPTNLGVLDALEKHADRSKDWSTLADALELRVEAESDVAAKVAVLQKLGNACEDHLDDVERAARAWTRVLELQPGHARAVRVLRDIYLKASDYQALEQLYESQEDFEGLAEVLSNAADNAAGVREKVDLSYRAAKVYETRLNQPERAFRSYERILSADPMDTKAAGALVPLYERDEKWARLPALYELLVTEASDADSRFELYSRLYHVSADRLSDREAAAHYARQAYEAAPGRDESIEQFSKACHEAHQWGPFVEALEAQLTQSVTPSERKGKKKKRKGKGQSEPADAGLEPEVARRLELSLAETYEAHLGQPRKAAAALKRVLQAEPTDARVGARLEGLLRGLEDTAELRWLFGFRAEHAADSERRIALLHDWASFETDDERAAELYLRILEASSADPRAIARLPELLVGLGRADRAAAIIEKHKGEADDEFRAQLELRLAELYLDALEQPEASLEAALRALEVLQATGGEVPRAVEVLQRLVEVDVTKRSAAQALADVYHSADESRREAGALEVLLGIEKEPRARLDLFTRGIGVYEQLDSHGKAFELALRACREFPEKIVLWDQGAALSAASGRPTELADVYREVLRGELSSDVRRQLCERAAELHEEQLGDPVGATPYLEQLLEANPGDAEAFAKLKQILTSAQRWDELQTLYDSAIEVIEDTDAKIEVLCEVAMICEEFMDDAKAAMGYYEATLEIDSHHPVALDALDRLWTQHGRFEELAGLLARRLQLASGDAAREFHLRLAAVYLDKLHEPEAAFKHVEDVLVEDLGNTRARELAERLLEVKLLRVPASLILERVYEARDEVRDLVRVLEIRLASQGARADASDQQDADLAERRVLLRRVAELKNDRLRDDEGALAAFLELVPLEPGYSEGRAELLEISGRLGASVRVAEALETASANADSLPLKGEILMQAARVYDEALKNRERAEFLFHQAMVLDPADPDLVLPAARALEQIQQESGAHKALVATLRVRLQLEQDFDARSELWARIAGLCENELDDVEAATRAWRARLEDNPEDALALASLDRLYERSSSWHELVPILEVRGRLVSDESERREFMRRIALVHAEKLKDTAAAIESYRAMIDAFGAEKATLSALADLLRARSDWEELADTVGMMLDATESEAERLDLLATLGDLRRRHLSNPGGALEAYRNITERDPAHARARAALQEMLGHEDPVNRKEAAEILQPLYEAEGDDKRLLATLVTLIDAEQDPIERLQAFERAAEVADTALSDPEQAFALTMRAVADAVGHADLKPWLERLERLARDTGKRREQTEVLRQIVPEVFDGDVLFSVMMRVASLAGEELDDRELALEYYRKALEVQPESDGALEALERLYAAGGDTPELLEVLERRAELAPDESGRKRLLAWRGRLLDEKMDQPDAAIGVFESILDIGLDTDAIEALEGLYTRQKRWESLIELYQRQMEAPGADRAALHIRVAGVAVERLDDANRAFDELEAALEADPKSDKAVAELERLMTEGDDAERHARAAEFLEPIYLSRADFDRVMQTIQARLEHADAIDRRELLQRLAQLHEEQKEDYPAALETTALLLHEDLTDEGTVAELERLAKVSDSRSRLVEIYASELAALDVDDASSARLCERCGELYRQLGDMDRALVFYRRALVFEPESVALFDAVDGILKALDKHDERVALHRGGLEHRFDPEDRLRLVHTIASLQNEQLGLKTEAIATYIEALEINPDDPAALDTLSRLYYETQRFEELFDLVLKRAELANSEQQAVTFRLALAKLCRHELGDSRRAVDQLEEIVRLDPRHAEAIAELESLRENSAERQRVVEILTPLYEQADDWRHLIKLNEDRFQLARDELEKVNVLRQTAALWEERGRDANRALQALVAAIQIDPEDVEVRSEFERLVELTGAWDKLSEVYSGVLAQNDGLSVARDYWLKLAQVHDGPRDDPRAALDAYDTVYKLEPTDIEPIERMEALATLLSDWETLDWVLVAKADLILDDEERASTWRRIGEGRRDMLGNNPAAIEAYEHAVELEPGSAFTLDSLIELYETEKNPQRLVELYQRRVEIADQEDVDLCYGLLLAASELYEKEFKDRRAAIDMLNQAAEHKPQDSEILDRLHRLYEAEEQWPELLDNLRAKADAADTVEARVRARRQMGDVLVKRLESFDDALESYALVLDEAPNDEHARARVLDLGEKHEELRERVADVLIPALETGEAHAQHVEVLEMRLTVESDPHTRAATLRSIATVLLERLDDPEGAKKALLRAMTDVPDELALHAWIEELSQRTGDWASYADALSERSQNTFDADLARDLYARLGNIAESRLNNPGRAIDAYRHAVEQVGDEPDLLASLDRLYAEAKNWTELVDILERRTPLVESDAERAAIYYRLAVVQLDEFGETGQGLASLQTALELEPNYEAASNKLEELTERRDLFEEASEILEGVYRNRGTTGKLADLYSKRVAFAETPGERIDMRRGLARVLEEELGDPAGAQKVLQQGLADDPADNDLVLEIERLAELSHDWMGAAAALEKVVGEARDLAPDIGKELCVRVAGWYADKAGEPESAERALKRAFELDSTSDDVLIDLEALQSLPGRELARVATLRARAKIQLDDADREELYRRAVSLADERGEAALVEETLREVLQLQPDATWALRALCELRSQADDHRETLELIARLLDVAMDADEIRDLRHRAAAIAEDRLGDSERAIELLEHALQDDPLDHGAAARLRRLLTAAERYSDLGGLLERQVDVTDDSVARAAVRLDLARLQTERFSAPDQAIETLRIAIEEDPTSSEAVVFLSRLYEELGKDEQLAELLTEQIEAAQARGDGAAELNLEVRLGEIYESKLAQPGRAVEAYRRVLERNPDHSGALSSLVRLHRAAEQWEPCAAALARLVDLVEGEEKARIHRELAQCYEALGDSDRVVGSLEAALAIAPEDSLLRANLKSLYEASASWEQLATLLADEATRASEEKDKVALLRQAAEIFAQKLGEHGRAAQLLEQANQLVPGDRPLLLDLCDAYSASSRTQEAISALEQIVESYGGRRSKELAEIHRRLATAFRAEGQQERAAAELDKAFRIEPGNISILRALGELSLELGDFKRAQQMYRALLLQKLEPGGSMTKAEVFCQLALVHHRLGETPKAQQMLDRALQADPDLTAAHDLREQLSGS